MSPVIRPWLPRSHPNFFLIYTATLLFHVWAGLNGVFGPDRWWGHPIYQYTNLVASPLVWGCWNLAIATAMFVGLHLHTFRWARIALGVGSTWVWARLLLFGMAWLEAGADAGNVMPVYVLVGALHISQVLEPPVNPQNARTRR